MKKKKEKDLKEISDMNLDGDWDNKKQVLVDELREMKTAARTTYYSNLEK